VIHTIGYIELCLRRNDPGLNYSALVEDNKKMTQDLYYLLAVGFRRHKLLPVQFRNCLFNYFWNTVQGKRAEKNSEER
jgi:hypothetical protein